MQMLRSSDFLQMLPLDYKKNLKITNYTVDWMPYNLRSTWSEFGSAEYERRFSELHDDVRLRVGFADHRPTDQRLGRHHSRPHSLDRRDRERRTRRVLDGRRVRRGRQPRDPVPYGMSAEASLPLY